MGQSCAREEGWESRPYEEDQPKPERVVLVKAMGSIRDYGTGTLKRPEGRRTRAANLDGLASPELKKYFNVVQCDEGHTMNAIVVPELLHRMMSCKDELAECSRCSATITSKDAYYKCAECDYDLCMTCARQSLGLRTERNSDLEEAEIIPISAGDSIFCGPDRNGIHHAILILSTLRTADSDVVEMLGAPPGWEFFTLKTIECTQSKQGIETTWYPTTTYIARDKYTGEAFLVADYPTFSDGTVYQAETPVSLKLLRHPLRKEFGSAEELDFDLFGEVTDEAAEEARRYGWSTCAKALVANYKIEFDDLEDEAAREQFFERLHTSWEKKPICAAVVVKVWQKYFEKLAEVKNTSDEVAIENILKYMPCWCDKTAPSSLIKVLTGCGWVLTDGIDA